MNCSNCGATNPPDGRFCLECGTALGGCPNCGAANPAGARFCGKCGTGLGAAVAPASAAAPVDADARTGATERRVVTVLFADLVGFTSLSADRDPETMRELQDRYFERTRVIVDRYGGVIEKFIGDAVMAMWGAPIAHEDDAERAVRAGLDLVDMVPALGREAGVDLDVRVAVLSGEAAVSVGAEGQGMVTGDLVNTASRLQSAAPPGGVLVGETTRIAAEAAIEFERAGDQELKGKATPVPAWLATRVVGERGGARRPDALEPPFVGRNDELRFLKEQFHAVGRERRARLVSLVGQAGIGKSRLAWELEKYLDGVVEQVWWHRGRSPSYGEGVTFWALGEMIRRRAGLVEGADEDATRTAVARMLREHVADETERGWIEPRMLVLLGIGESPAGGRTELFAAWRTFFERLAETGTVAFVVEDLQWSDDGLLDFLEHLLDWGRSSPIFVLTLARPELLERRPGWGTDRRGAISMRLDPLTDSAMREMLDGMIPGLSEAVSSRIVERADGLPLYAVETIRMLLASGRLVQDGPRLVAAGKPLGATDVGALDVPPTLHALVAARLDRLEAGDRSLLQDAAVLGQTFTLEGLAAISGQTADHLAARLDVLVRREILTVETDPRAPTRGQHAFVQAIVREVAYGTLAKRERRERHLAAARYLESLGDDELAGAVASHFVAAYRAAPDGPPGEAVAAQARVSLLAAGDRAEALGALGQAIDSLTFALEVTRIPRDHASLLERVGFLQILASRFDDGQTILAAAVEAYRGIGDEIGMIRATTRRSLGYLAAAQIASAAEVMRPVQETAEALAMRDDLISADANRDAAETAALFAEASGRIAFRSEDLAEAIRWSEQALVLAEPLRIDEIVAMALVTKGTSLIYSGHRREGIALLQGAVLDAHAHGQSLAALRGTNNIASTISETDPRASLETSREGMALARRLGMLSFDGYHAGNASGAAERLGEWAWAEEAIGDLLQGHPEGPEADWIASCAEMATAWTGDPNVKRAERLHAIALRENDWQTELNTALWLARCSFAAGRPADALRWSEALIRHAENDPTTFDFAMVARFAQAAGRPDIARHLVELYGNEGGGIIDTDLTSVRAGVAAVEGRTGDAIALYRSALAGYREAGCRFDVALTVLDMASLIGPDDPAVRSVLPEGREILESLGARLLIERLDAVDRDGRPERPTPREAGTPTEASAER
ncbi:MAG: AAA family ATPase [Chloroflexota bacterium]